MPFLLATANKLMALNRDITIQEECGLETREMRVVINAGSCMPITTASPAISPG